MAQIEDLLPNEPAVPDPERAAALTAAYLQPALQPLHACLLAVRLQLDPALQQHQPFKNGKPYPLGQCLEISLAVRARLEGISVGELPPDAREGLLALRRFIAAGGSFRNVWGALREQYFQNAFQLGTLYADVSNDTVVPTKPKVEILPFEAAQFRPVRDFQHYREVAGRYWRCSFHPNHVLPELAPFLPLVRVDESGELRLADLSDYMLWMTMRARFRPSVAMLSQDEMPRPVFERLAAAAAGTGVLIAKDPAQGRNQGLSHCDGFARRFQPPWQNLLQQLAEAGFLVNERLAQLYPS